jgi:hypothetical protein
LSFSQTCTFKCRLITYHVPSNFCGSTITAYDSLCVHLWSRNIHSYLAFHVFSSSSFDYCCLYTYFFHHHRSFPQGGMLKSG